VASRSEFWYFYLFYVLVSIASITVDSAAAVSLGIASFALFNTLVTLGLFLPTLAVAIRRFHDAGFSAWWYSASQVIVALPLIWVFVEFVRVVLVISPTADAAQLEAWLNDALTDPTSTFLGDLAYAATATNIFVAVGLFVLVAIGSLIFCLVVVLLPTKTPEAGNRHAKVQVAPFAIAHTESTSGTNY
jgi:uncharacterized membrane protein YhaH (DUF805 family)